MKRILALLLAFAMVFALAACGEKKDPAPAEADSYKLGMGISVPAASVKEATADEDASAQVSPCVAVILVDKDGAIAACKFDVAQSKAFVTADGVVLDKEQSFRTKDEKKEDYGMQKASPLAEGEWYQQAAFLANYLVGKTLEDINAIELKDAYPTDADILAGCTIHITDFIAALNDAFSRLQDAGQAVSISLGVNTDIKGSKDISADEDGQIFFASYYGAAALDAEGFITSAIIDETQLKFPVGEGGVIGEMNNDLSKIQLQDAYGMQVKSSLQQGEWYQQSAYLTSKLVGLDKAGVQAIAMDEKTYPTDADILAGCTMKIGSMLECLVKGM